MRKSIVGLFASAVGAAAVLLALSSCQPPVDPQDLLRVGDTIKPTITVNSHQAGDPFAEPTTTITGTITDLAKEDKTAGQITSSNWAVEGSSTGGVLTLATDGSFSLQVDTLSRAIELVAVITAKDWNNNEETLRLSLAVPKEITSFAFEAAHNPDLPFDAVGTITGTNIEVKLASGTVKSALVATYAATGANVKVAGIEQQSSVTLNDFGSPLSYSVIGKDNRAKDYTVTVTEVTLSYGQAAAPTFSPAPGKYDHDISVSLTTATPGGVIYYSTDGSLPTSGSTRYAAAIPVAGHGASLALIAATYAPGYTPSETSGAFSISYPVPAAPDGLTASPLQVYGVHLLWTDNSVNETGFEVQRSTTGAGDWLQVHQTGPNVASWDDTGLSAGATYFYRVRATNSGAESPYSNIAYETAVFAEMVIIAAAGDSFTMGDGTYGPNKAESISHNYELSKYEVTNAQFAQFIADGGYTTSSFWTTNGWTRRVSMGWTHPGSWGVANFSGVKQPVLELSWYEAVAFCNWLSQKEGLTPAYDDAGHATLTATGYRLPTEVEWEYAAAKGASGQAERIYAWGNTWDSGNAVCSVSPASASKTADVGSKSTAGDTPQGLADMSGNVWEWCSDNWQADTSVGGSPPSDRYYFANDESSSLFVLRGGSYCVSNESSFRCGLRGGENPGTEYDFDGGFGLRLCRP